MLFLPTCALQRCSYSSSGVDATCSHPVHRQSMSSSTAEAVLALRAWLSSGVIGSTEDGEPEEEMWDEGSGRRKVLLGSLG